LAQASSDLLIPAIQNCETPVPMGERDAAEARTELEHEFLDNAKSFNWSSVKGMLDETPDLINVQPCGRWTALHQAAFEGNADMAKYLLEKGADLAATTRAGKRPVDVANNATVKQVFGDEDGAPEVKVEPPAAEAVKDEAQGDADATPEATPSPAKKARKSAVSKPYNLNINQAVDKEYEGSSFKELCSAPVGALQGIGPKGQEIFKKLKIKTVKDLALYKFYRIAKSMVALAPTEQAGKREEGALINVNSAMDKAHEAKSLKEMIALKPSALQGLAPWVDDEFAAHPLQVTTIEKLGTLKYCKWAEAIVELAEFETSDLLTHK